MTQVRFVLDTNVLLSAALFKNSLARKAFDVVVTSASEIILSIPVLEELTDVLSRSRFDRYVSIEIRNQFLADFLELVEMVDITRTAQFILTNDKDLLVLNPYESISIVEPVYFLAMRLDRIEN